MKKIFYFISLAVMALMLSGCEASSIDNPSIDTQEGVLVTLNALSSSSGEGTKAGYDETDLSYWNNNDEIGVSINTNKNVKFTQKDGTLSADYRSVVYEGTLSGLDGSSTTLWAKYPYVAGEDFTSTSLTTIMGNQFYANSSGYHFPLALASTTGNISSINDAPLKFSCPFTTVKLSLYTSVSDVKVTSIIFSGNNSEKIAGEMIFTLGTDGTVTLDNSKATSGVIILNTPSDVTISEDDSNTTDFYITVPNLNYTLGFRIQVNTNKGVYYFSRKSATDWSSKGNTIICMPPYEVTPELMIHDDNFRNALKTQNLINVIDEDKGIVTITAAGLAVTTINVTDKNISDLTGISYFPALKTLECYNNNLTFLDLSACATLETVVCYTNKTLANILLPTNTSNLKGILAMSCLLNYLDLSRYTNLEILYCQENPHLTSLILPSSSCTSFTSLYCEDCPLSSIDLSEYSSLTEIGAGSSFLAELTLPTVKTNLTNFTLYKTDFTSVDISAYTNLINVDIYENPCLTSITLPPTPNKIEYIYICKNAITSFDLSGYSQLMELSCGYCSLLTSLTLPSTTDVLEYLDCPSCALSSLDVTIYTNLSYLDCASNRLSSLDASNMANPSNYILFCGRQTTDGTTVQNLALTLSSAQQTFWESNLVSAKDQEEVLYNSNVNVTYK